MTLDGFATVEPEELAAALGCGTSRRLVAKGLDGFNTVEPEELAAALGCGTSRHLAKGLDGFNTVVAEGLATALELGTSWCLTNGFGRFADLGAPFSTKEKLGGAKEPVMFDGAVLMDGGTAVTGEPTERVALKARRASVSPRDEVHPRSL